MVDPQGTQKRGRRAQRAVEETHKTKAVHPVGAQVSGHERRSTVGVIRVNVSEAVRSRRVHNAGAGYVVISEGRQSWSLLQRVPTPPLLPRSNPLTPGSTLVSRVVSVGTIGRSLETFRGRRPRSLPLK